MATTATRKRARDSRRTRNAKTYSGRRFGTSTPCVKPDGPSRSQLAADAALATVLDLFDSGNLPDAIAQTVIARHEGTSPSAFWSLGNQLLMICAGTSDARGFRQWETVGRSVCKGSKAFYILGPSTRKINETDATTGAETDRVVVTGFRGIPVFRYEDTSGATIENPDYAPPASPPLAEVAAQMGVSVEYLPFVQRARGYYSLSRDEIVLCSHDVSVFFHELAHAAHERVLQARGATLQGGQVPGQEIVAETVAATLCSLYGFEGYLYHGAEYVRRYAGEKSPAKAAMKVLADVQAVLYLILDAATPEGPAPEVEPDYSDSDIPF